jgi:hypothetical protein
MPAGTNHTISGEQANQAVGILGQQDDERSRTVEWRLDLNPKLGSATDQSLRQKANLVGHIL